MSKARHLGWVYALLVATAIGCGDDASGGDYCQLPGYLDCTSPTGEQYCPNGEVDPNNCGACGKVCPQDRHCQGATCVCVTGLLECVPGGVCSNTLTDSLHCGKCNNPCGADTPLCSNGVCSASCAANLIPCGTACVDISSDIHHCGRCNNLCSGTCNNGVCTPRAGVAGNGAGGTTIAGSGGQGGMDTAGGGGAGAGGVSPGTGGTVPDPTGSRPSACPASWEMISDFEEGAGTPVVMAGTGIEGTWEVYHNSAADNAGAVGEHTMAVESSGDTAECKKFALHTYGSGWGAATTGWVGIGLTHMAGAKTAPAVYPNTNNYIGIRFRAKLGPNHTASSPVRINISTPNTEGTGSYGSCTETSDTPEKAALPCYQHMGRFLHEDLALSTTWKEITLCFDRDLYPLTLPSNLSNAQRDAIGSNILKIQFQFNQAKDWTLSGYPTEGKYADIPTTAPFDFWLDDIQFIAGECPNNQTFQSSAGTTHSFPQNQSGGSCSIVPNAAKFNTAITQAYERWTRHFVRADGNNLRVIAPEQENGVTTSEAMGYGMMIAAAMGDKPSFDKMWGYVQGHLSGGLMTWKTGGSGSATDGDEDIAYGLLMADVQWPGSGYKSAADNMAGAILSQDVDGSNVLKGGSGWRGPFNPSYFAPAVLRKFAGFDAAISKAYQLVNANISAPTAGLPTDWADPSSGAPSDSGGAQVTSQLPGVVFGYDAARVPWRLGLDVCTGGGSDASASLNSVVSFFAAKYNDGDKIDLLKAGWDKASGSVATNAKNMQGSFIGPMGVAAMAVGGTTGSKMRDRSFRTILDILAYGDFNHTYFPSTLGLLTALAMSGNFPTP